MLIRSLGRWCSPCARPRSAETLLHHHPPYRFTPERNRKLLSPIRLDLELLVPLHLELGGMATVYLANDLKHNRNVALKVLKPELAAVVGAER